jgi:hypothetical protein
MPIGDKAGRAAFFADLGGEAVRLSELPTSFTNPIRIGKAVPICPDGGLACVADFYVTPGGAVAVSFPSLSEDDRDALQCCARAVRAWSHEQLDDIASDFFYETEGQAALVIDIMARMGFLTYSDTVALNSAVDKTLANGDFILTVGELPFFPVRYSRRQFIGLFCEPGGIDPDDMTNFICELETIDGISATVQDADLVVAFSPPGDCLPVPLFRFTHSRGRSDLCVSPHITRYALERNGLPLSASDGLFDFFAGFADKDKVKPSPEDGSVALLYLVPDALFDKVQGLIGELKAFALSVS